MSANNKWTRSFVRNGIWVAKYIWHEKKDLLTKRDVPWFLFVHAIAKCSNYVLGWVLGKIGWEKLLEAIEKEVEIIKNVKD